MKNGHSPFRNSLAAIVLLSTTLLLAGCAAPGTPASNTQPSPPTNETPAAGPVTWSKQADAPRKQWESLGLAAGGKLYVFGGFINGAVSKVQGTTESYAYDPALNRWADIAPLPEPLTHSGQAVDGDTIWLAGGFVGNFQTYSTTAHVWKYDIGANTYTAGPSLPDARAGGALVLLDRQLHFFGGTKFDGQTYHDFSTHWSLNLDDPQAGWQEKAPYPALLNHMGGAALNGRIYGVGGQRGSDERFSNSALVFAYDPGTDTWTRRADLAHGRAHISASVFPWQGKLVAIGGLVNLPPGSAKAGGQPTASVEAYDPGQNAWTELTPLPVPRMAPVASAVGSQIIVATGDNDAPFQDTWTGQERGAQ